MVQFTRPTFLISLSSLLRRTTNTIHGSRPSSRDSTTSTSVNPHMFTFSHASRLASRSRSSSPLPTSTQTTHCSRPGTPKLTTFHVEHASTSSDAETWEKMLDLQMQFHCYNSARLEAAVEARMNGHAPEMIARPSRLCLDLLNEELRIQIESDRGFDP